MPTLPLPLDQSFSWPEAGVAVQLLGYSGLSYGGGDENTTILMTAGAEVLPDSNLICEEVYGQSPFVFAQPQYLCPEAA